MARFGESRQPRSKPCYAADALNECQGAEPRKFLPLNSLAPLQKHFHRYLMVGGFPELALSKDDYYAQRLLREDVVDKVLKAAFYYRSNTRVGYYRKTGGNEKEVDVVVEFPQGKILTEVKYRENAVITEKDAIVEISRDERMGVSAAIVVTKKPEDYGVISIKTKVPIMKIPAHAFLYLLGHAEKTGYLKGK